MEAMIVTIALALLEKQSLSFSCTNKKREKENNNQTG
jgi:hypothetical protein